jgi:hypothetical protein
MNTLLSDTMIEQAKRVDLLVFAEQRFGTMRRNISMYIRWEQSGDSAAMSATKNLLTA